MTPRIRLTLVAAVTLLWLHTGHAQDRFDTELSFCATINTPMPDPAAPSFYSALPTSTGKSVGAGASGHVKAWFTSMRDRNTGAAKQYLDHDAALSAAAKEYRRAVIEQGGKLLEQTDKSTFKKSVKDLNTKTNGKVLDLVNRYVNESRAVAGAYKELREALLGVGKAKKELASVQDDYEAFLNEMRYKKLSAEKAELLRRAEETQQLLSMVLGSLASANTFVPFDATSIMKGLTGAPV
ncbi:MAG: hypothetical protein ACREJR_14150, partial [Candidatus Rokuibacteriota bacterium]